MSPTRILAPLAACCLIGTACPAADPDTLPTPRAARPALPVADEDVPPIGNRESGIGNRNAGVPDSLIPTPYSPTASPQSRAIVPPARRQVIRYEAEPEPEVVVVRRPATRRVVEVVEVAEPTQAQGVLVRPGLFGRTMGYASERLRYYSLPRVDLGVTPARPLFSHKKKATVSYVEVAEPVTATYASGQR